MRIQHNISAMNSYRNFSANNSNLSKNLEKLSTGYKINRAGDDAAGLAISEKMRAQITGLEGATKNAKDGISLIQTAEGALTEVHSMLNRMTTLAEQSANGTYDDSLDRQQLQKEVDALKSEIDRIADSTNYNGIKLLDGSLSGASNVKGGVTLDTVDATYNKASTKALQAAEATAWISAGGTAKAGENGDKVSYTVSWRDKNGNSKATTIEFTLGDNNASPATAAGALIAKDGTKYALGTAGKLEAFTANGTGDFQQALLTELNKDEEFSANFKASIATSDDIAASDGGTADSVKGTILFTSKEEGTSGAVIESVQLKTHSKMDDGTYKTKDLGDATSNQIGARANGIDSAQEVKLDNIRVLALSDVTETDGRIEKNTFEINGKKFALMNNTDSASIQKFKDAVGSDVTLIQVASASDATYSKTSGDAETIAGELSRVTGMSFIAKGDKVITAGDTKLQTAKGKSLDLQIGDTADTFNKLSVNVKDMHVASIGVADVDISNQEGAAAALDKIKTAINNVSDQRGSLGALQNRLDHTLNNLGVMRENIQNAESLIRDTDIAEEMMAYTKNNILNQSAQAMLAQANQLPQGVLQLLG